MAEFDLHTFLKKSVHIQMKLIFSCFFLTFGYSFSKSHIQLISEC